MNGSIFLEVSFVGNIAEKGSSSEHGGGCTNSSPDILSVATIL
jgi:hypothetical protein